jgi:hypothetical protein
MKTKTELPEMETNDNVLVANIRDMVRVVSGVLKLTKKIFML